MENRSIGSFRPFQRATSDSIAVVPSFQLFLIRFPVGSKRWGNAYAYQGPPLGQPWGQTQEPSTTGEILVGRISCSGARSAPEVLKFAQLAFLLLLVVLKSDLTVGPEVVPGRHIHHLIF